jgi:hypothetical protein
MCGSSTDLQHHHSFLIPSQERYRISPRMMHHQHRSMAIKSISTRSRCASEQHIRIPISPLSVSSPTHFNPSLPNNPTNTPKSSLCVSQPPSPSSSEPSPQSLPPLLQQATRLQSQALAQSQPMGFPSRLQPYVAPYPLPPTTFN